MDYREEYIIKVTKIKKDAEKKYEKFIEENADECILKMLQDLIEDCEVSINKMQNYINNSTY